MNKLVITLAIISQTFLSGIIFADDNIQDLKGIYFGQVPPGKQAELFAPEFISINGRYEFGITFTADLQEVYFSGNKAGEMSTIFYTKQIGGKWLPVKKADFTRGKVVGELHPFISHDGKRIYFTTHDMDYMKNEIWYVDKKSKGWGEAKKINSPINDLEVFDSNEAANGDLFYTDIFNAKIYHATNVNGTFPKVEELPIVSGLHGYASQDQDFIILDDIYKEDASRKDRDLYIYFKKKDGSWTEAINLGPQVNTSYSETVPSLSPDGKYLFFSRYNEKNGLSNLYWISSEVIEVLRPKK